MNKRTLITCLIYRILFHLAIDSFSLNYFAKKNGVPLRRILSIVRRRAFLRGGSTRRWDDGLLKLLPAAAAGNQQWLLPAGTRFERDLRKKKKFE